MGIIASTLRNVGDFVFPKYVSRLWTVGRLGDERDYKLLVGDGTQNALVQAIASFIVHGFTQTFPVVAVSKPENIDSTEMRADHAAALLYRRPTYDPDIGRGWYSWQTMTAGLVLSFIADGNGYLIKVRSRAGRVVQLWYAPHFMMEPRWDLNAPNVFVKCYDYAPFGSKLYEGPQSIGGPEGPVFQLPPTDVIHIRDGLDPQNPRKGLGKIKALLREIYTDEEAARWTSSLLRNNGVPGVVISPKDGVAVKEDADEVKRRFQGDFSGDNLGRPIVLRGATQVQQFSYSPDAMKLRDIRAIPEERISAALGVPAAVVGFGAGLEHTKVGKTMQELVDLAWQNGILPKLRIFAAELTEQLVSEWEEGAALTHDFAFDTARAPIMGDYHKSLAERLQISMNSSFLTRAEARRMIGMKPGVRDNVYLVQAGTAEVDASKTIEAAPLLAPATAPAPGGEQSATDAAPAPVTKPATAASNGNGHASTPLDETEVVVAD